MADSVGNLNLKISADTQGFTQGVQRAENDYQRFTRKLQGSDIQSAFNNSASRVTSFFDQLSTSQSTLGAIQTALGGIAASAAATMGPVGLFAGILVGGLTAISGAARTATGELNEVYKFSQRTGTSPRDAQILRRVFERGGLDRDQVDTVLNRYAARIGDLRTNPQGELGRTMRRLGIDPTRNSRLSLLESLRETVSGIGALTDAFERNSAAQDVFGRSFSDLLGLISNAGEVFSGAADDVGRFGASDEAIQRAVQVERTFRGLNREFDSTWREIRSHIVEAVVAASPYIVSLLRDVRETAASLRDVVTWAQRVREFAQYDLGLSLPPPPRWAGDTWGGAVGNALVGGPLRFGYRALTAPAVPPQPETSQLLKVWEQAMLAGFQAVTGMAGSGPAITPRRSGRAGYIRHILDTHSAADAGNLISMLGPFQENLTTRAELNQRIDDQLNQLSEQKYFSSVRFRGDAEGLGYARANATRQEIEATRDLLRARRDLIDAGATQADLEVFDRSARALRAVRADNEANELGITWQQQGRDAFLTPREIEIRNARERGVAPQLIGTLVAEDRALSVMELIQSARQIEGNLGRGSLALNGTDLRTMEGARFLADLQTRRAGGLDDPQRRMQIALEAANRQRERQLEQNRENRDLLQRIADGQQPIAGRAF